MSSLKQIVSVLLGIASGFFVDSANAWAQPSGPDGGAPFQYAVKLVCGVQKESQGVVPQNYATTINIHNPNPNGEAQFHKKLVLTIPPGGQKPGEIFHISDDLLGSDGALATDCMDIRRRVPGLPPFFEGFVVLQSFSSLDVVAVYTVPGGIDVVQAQERRFTPH